MGRNKARHRGLFSGFPAICKPTLGHLPFACPVCADRRAGGCWGHLSSMLRLWWLPGLPHQAKQCYFSLLWVKRCQRGYTVAQGVNGCDHDGNGTLTL